MPLHPKAHTRQFKLTPRQRRIGFALVGLLLLFSLVLVLSPYYALWTLKKQLGWVDSEQRLEPSQIEQIIPKSLWESRATTTAPKIRGHGQNYLKNIWPVLQQHADQAKFLQLQLQFYAQENIQTGYSDFPNQFRLQLGESQQIDMILQRDGIWSWSVYALCTREAQPLLDLNHCPSDS
ncbi:MAG: hypothetical protein WA154_03125 [Moraxellaceae bacterium]